jgi:GT2 family glycosyltransferase
MSTAAIVAALYEEPEYEQTIKCLNSIRCLKAMVPREPAGVGSLANTYNRGFDTVHVYNGTVADYVWFVSNPTFAPGTFEALVKAMDDNPDMAAIHPAFNSDHAHLRPDGSSVVKEVPFVEFTAPMVRADVFAKLLLDEEMPYWGHDLAWSHEAKKLGYKLGVHHGVQIQHTYIRHNKTLHPVTQRRHELRKRTNATTNGRLVALYGTDWERILNYKR